MANSQKRKRCTDTSIEVRSQPDCQHDASLSCESDSSLGILEAKRNRFCESDSALGILEAKRDRNHSFIYGNYPFYYRYRTNESGDPRLQYLNREWIEGKDCLDIGCNEGVFTLELAEKLNCKNILGMDIDGRLIAKAKERLQERKKSGIISDKLYSRVKFFAHNYLEGSAREASYDIIFCLSVTKWVHLNWGDEGLIQLFSKIKSELRLGGVLILESQPWKSYRKSKGVLVSDAAKLNFKTVGLRPNHFPYMLIEKIGFKSWQILAPSQPLGRKGFRRPIYAYWN